MKRKEINLAVNGAKSSLSLECFPWDSRRHCNTSKLRIPSMKPKLDVFFLQSTKPFCISLTYIYDIYHIYREI